MLRRIDSRQSLLLPFRLLKRWPALVAIGLLGCGGSDNNSGPATATVAVAPGTSLLTTAQTLPVTIAVSGNATAAPSGTVTLTSGAFSSGPIALTTASSTGTATTTVPAGVLNVGADNLSVQYTPSAGNAYSVASAAAVVNVTQAAAPTVTAQSTNVSTNGHPFQALPVGANVFVSVSANTDVGSVTGIRVYGAGSPSQLTYRCTQLASHPNHLGMPFAFGLAATPNGLGLALAIDDAGVDLLNATTTAATCSSTEMIVSQGAVSTVPGTFAVAITPDGKYAFVANEYGVVAADSAGVGIQGNVGVIALQSDASGNVTGGTLVGNLSTGGQAIANVTLSPDGRRLYVTSEIASAGTTVAGTGNSTLAHGGCVQPGTDANGNPVTVTSTYGLLSVIDVAKAEAAPTSAAIVATVAAGCSPVRVVETSDQQVVWVAARGDNAVLAFSTQMLETNPSAALLGSTSTGGIAPVGLQLLHGGQLLAVANSNRFAMPAVFGNMTLIAATPVAPRVVQTVPAYYFPRSVSVAADDATLYLTDYNSGTVQVVTTTVQ